MAHHPDHHTALNDALLIATAGHVDHGKSTLVMGLTGTDPDRWAEEKQRGITIDLGYAHLHHEGRVYSFVDVPGHERFVHNMLAGIGAVDAVLFVIAADESIMPQTREHALALRFLGIEQVCVVITKIDLVDDDLLEILEAEIEDWLAENGWSDAPRVHFSAKRPETRQNVLDLLARLGKQEPPAGGAFRMSMDRVFSSPGSGTVITGTVDRGRLSADERVFLQPRDTEARIRQIQIHGETVSEATAHLRAALNLGDVHYRDLRRGNLIFAGTRPATARKALIRLMPFEGEWQPSSRHWFHVHHLAAKLRARLLWREGELAALELDQPYPFWALDRAIIRDGSPLRVLAGFEVLDPDLRRSKRGQVLAQVGSLPPAGNLAAWQNWIISRSDDPFRTEDMARRCGAPLVAEVAAELVELDASWRISQNHWQHRCHQWLAALRQAHAQRPCYAALPLSHLNSLFTEPRWPKVLLDRILIHFAGEGDIVLKGDRIKAADHRVKWSPADRALLEKFLARRERGLFDFRGDKATQVALADIEALLVWEKYIIPLATGIFIHHQSLTQILATLQERFGSRQFSVPELKELFGFTRKIAIPLLEFLDKNGYTRREADGRVWIGEARAYDSSAELPGET